MEDDLRRRLDTGCTIESKDSGIEVRLMKPPPRGHHHHHHKTAEQSVNNLEMESEGNWDIASFLWIAVFVMTIWIFHLPISIWFSHKVNWNLMYLALFFYAASLSAGLFLYIKYRGLAWSKYSPLIYRVSVCFFFTGSFCFCSATFALFGWMSVGICFVTLMFLLSLSEILT